MLSKSRYLAGLQCAKRLWTEIHAPELLPPIDAAKQALFDQGHEVGRWAKQLCPGGIEISPKTRNWTTVVEATGRALTQRRPLYEAGFRKGDAACRVDILVPVGDRRWDLYEVKSSTSVKDVHVQDVALQAHVLEGAGVGIRDYYLVHVDNTYVRRGEIEPERLFRKVKITEQTRSRQPMIEVDLAGMRSTLEEENRPQVAIGSHCRMPYECPLVGECWTILPPASVFSLVEGRKRALQLFELGITDLLQVPEGEELSDRQRIQLRAVRSGEPHVDSRALKGFLGQLRYPIYFFDIETFGSAVPLFDESRPYQQIPFLFSVHRVERPGETARHFSHLVKGRGDPRGEFLRASRSALEESGSVVSYNAPFERRVLLETAEAVPEFLDWARALEGRLIDLMAPFRSFAYHHPGQLGSVSLKAVLPALTGVTYGDLEIADGETASREYLRVAHEEVDPSEKDRILRHLEEYCSLDTAGMVAIVEKLSTLV